MKQALRAASLLLIAGMTTACGGDDGAGAPEDASVDEFCKPFTDAQADDDAKVADVADELNQVGTPEDIPDDARKGFEFLIDNAEDLDKTGDDLDDEEAFKDKYGDDASAQIEAFIDYLAKTCVPEVPTSELPTPTEPELPEPS